MTYTLPELTYGYDALEPYIDGQTMRIHHSKHHAGYVTNLNKVLEGHPELVGKSIDDLLAEIWHVPFDIRTPVNNHGGGHSNHAIFWTTLAPAGKGGGGEPKDNILLNAITTAFGDFGRFKEAFTKTALDRFGSGWVWLSQDVDGKLIVESFPNQDSPLCRGYKPLLGLDLWEHAYYLKYQNRRADYIEAWWNVVNWHAVTERFVEVHGYAEV